MRYKEFFRIEIDHQYFSPDGAADLAVHPDGPTLRFLRGQHLLLKSIKNGVKVLIPIDENGNTKPVFRPGDGLTFEVYPQSSSFSLFTAASGLAKGQVIHFSNQGLTGTNAQLLSSTSVGIGALNGFPMVAKVEIQLSNELLSSSTSVPYQVGFQARSEKWKYYFVTDKDTTDIAVEDRGENLVFNKLQIDAQSTDQLGISLRSNFPEANLFRFESTTPIPCSDQALKNLQLLRDGHVLIKHLPNPEMAEKAVKIIRIHR